MFDFTDNSDFNCFLFQFQAEANSQQSQVSQLIYYLNQILATNFRIDLSVVSTKMKVGGK